MRQRVATAVMVAWLAVVSVWWAIVGTDEVEVSDE